MDGGEVSIWGHLRDVLHGSGYIWGDRCDPLGQHTGLYGLILSAGMNHKVDSGETKSRYACCATASSECIEPCLYDVVVGV